MQQVKIVEPTTPYTRTATGAVVFDRSPFNGEVYVYLVTSLKGPFWVIPKGGLEEGLTLQENAVKEMREEGGLVITVRPEAVFYEVLDYPAFDKYEAKTQREIYYLGELVELAEVWDEEGMRDVGWFTFSEAVHKVSEVQLEVLEQAYAAYLRAQ